MSEGTETTEKPKAYDLKVLAEKMKQEGLEVAEDAAGKMVKCVMIWLKDSAVKSENPFDDMIAPFLIPIEKYIMNEIDKIDGKKG